MRIGLVEFISPVENLLDEAIIIARAIASYSCESTSSTKRCINVGLRNSMEAGLTLESDLRVKTSPSADAVEGRNAFIEKRPPNFNQD